MSDSTLQKTSRREAREGYARFLLGRIGLTEEDVDVFMDSKQAVLDNMSPLELIYSGEYERAISAVETFTEDLQVEENFNGFSGSFSDTAQPDHATA